MTYDINNLDKFEEIVNNDLGVSSTSIVMKLKHLNLQDRQEAYNAGVEDGLSGKIKSSISITEITQVPKVIYDEIYNAGGQKIADEVLEIINKLKGD